MKTILMTALLACTLFAGACSRKPAITAALATPEPVATPRPSPPQMTEAEFEAERQREIAARAEADRLLAVPTPQSEYSAPIISGSDPDPSGLAPTANFEANDRITGLVSGTEVEVVSSSGKVILAQAKTNGKGAIIVQLPGPGKYQVRYTTGPSKGKVAKTITATEAGSVNLSIPPPSAAP